MCRVECGGGGGAARDARGAATPVRVASNTLSRKRSFTDQRLSHRNRIRMIHFQDSNRSSSDRRQSSERRAVPPKMFGPLIFSWVKQSRELVTLRIESSDIWPFVSIAVKAGHGEIAGLAGATVLLGNDVIDLEWQFGEGYREMTILTSILSSLPKERIDVGDRRHCLLGRESLERKPGL